MKLQSSRIRMEYSVVKCENGDLFKIIKIICWILHEKYSTVCMLLYFVLCSFFYFCSFKKLVPIKWFSYFVWQYRDRWAHKHTPIHIEHFFRFNENFSAAMTTNWHCRWIFSASIDVTVIVAFVCIFFSLFFFALSSFVSFWLYMILTKLDVTLHKLFCED